MTQQLEIRLFGTLRVQRRGGQITPPPSRRVKDLLGYLALTRHSRHSREQLAEVFWDGAEHDNPRHCLNTVLWRLHRALGEPDPDSPPYLHVDAQEIGFNAASDCWIDVAEFERCCQRAAQLGATSPDEQARAFQQAVSLYTADLLVDCYADWALPARQRLQLQYVDALGTLISYHSARAEHGQAIAYALQLLASDPLREDVHCTVMRLYLASGQPGAALRQYQECGDVLRQELGVKPSAETQAVALEVLRHWQHAAAAPAPHSLGSAGTAPRAMNAPPPATAARGAKAGGMASATAVAEAEAARPAQVLSEALVRLRSAIADFDMAHAALRDAAASLTLCVDPALVSSLAAKSALRGVQSLEAFP